MTEPADEIPETTPGQAAYLLAREELQSAKSRNDHDHCLSCPFRGCDECRYQEPDRKDPNA